MPDTDTLLEINDLTRHFDVSPPTLQRVLRGKARTMVKALDGVTFTIRRGETFSLVGESGCGKTTVARCVVGLYRPTSGNIVFDGVDLGRLKQRKAMAPLRRRMQMIFQDPYASLNPRWRVRKIVAEPLVTHRLVAGSKAELNARVDELLEQVRLSTADGDKFPHEFSGGQRQRISIARALAAHPEFLVCDEPTSALDVSIQAQILNLMKDLQRRLGLTYLFISHNLAVIYQISDRVGVMYLGRLVEVASTDELFSRPRHPYTRLLLETIPRLSPDGEREPLAGEVPNPIDPPRGCAFHPRCQYANDRCRSDRPSLLAADSAFVACHAVEERRL
jgi:peptide/nickel transport system ATP-binding protein